MKNLGWMTVIFAFVGPMACGGETNSTTDGGVTTTIEPKLSEIQKHVFVGCATSSCHSPSGKQGNLDLTAANAYVQLLGADGQGAPTDNAAAKADGLLRVKPGDPSKSFLLLKCQKPVDSKYGLLMPYVGDELTSEKLKAISDWITAGALNN